jgi:hypothetical protein
VFGNAIETMFPQNLNLFLLKIIFFMFSYRFKIILNEKYFEPKPLSLSQSQTDQNGKREIDQGVFVFLV